MAEGASILPEKSGFIALPPHNRFVCFASATGNDPAVKVFLEALCGPKLGSYTDGEISNNKGWYSAAVEFAAALPPNIAHGLISCPRIKVIQKKENIFP
jgi:hypothetical protein